jgi:hypothetical protein
VPKYSKLNFKMQKKKKKKKKEKRKKKKRKKKKKCTIPRDIGAIF